MRTLLCTTSVLLLSVSSCLAQVSTMGTTAMGVPTTPGAIVSSPLTGPGPFTSLFSAATVPGAPATTLASPPLAQNPTIPGTSVNCAPMMVELSPSVMSVTSTNATAPASPIAAMSSMGTTAMPGAAPVTRITPLSPTTTATISSPMSTTTTPSPILAAAMPVTIMGSVAGSSTGTLASASPLGGSMAGGSCTSAPGNTLTNAAALPLSTPDIPVSPPPGTIQSPTADHDPTDTSISPVMNVMPTPNTAACSENISMDLANPTMMAPANPTGAAATPGVSPPSGC
jgi:hypothetical protein